MTRGPSAGVKLAGGGGSHGKRCRLSRAFWSLVFASLAGAAILGMAANQGLRSPARDALPSVIVLPAQPDEGASEQRGPAAGPFALPVEGGPPLILDAALFEITPHGFAPHVAPDGRRARDVHRRRGLAGPGPVISILLVDIGLDEQASKLAMALPAPITMAISAYADPAAGWYRMARWAGHETLLELPARPARFPNDDAGPLALSPEVPDLVPLQAVLARGIGYLGVTIEAGAFAERPPSFAALAEALAGRGLGLVEINANSLESIARRFALSYLSVTGPIDADSSVQAIDAALSALEGRAAAEGFAVGYGHPLPATIDRLSQWSAGLAARGISLAGIGEILSRERAAQGLSK